MRRDQERKEQDNMERKEKELERIMIFKILQIHEEFLKSYY